MKINAKEIRTITAELDDSIEDLLHEYGLNTEKVKAQKGGEVAKHFAAASFDLDQDVMDVGVERGRLTSQMLEEMVGMARIAGVEDQVLSMMVESVIGAMWVQGLMTGIALGRSKFPAEKA
jgi:hypothetical protein